MADPILIPPDHRYGMWTVIREMTRGYEGTDHRAYRRCLVRCDCGRQRPVRLHDLRTGASRSCGRHHRWIHGHGIDSHKSPEYRSWTSMLARCRNPRSTGYKYYGGRGITVCTRWLRFENFLADMGPRPRPSRRYTLDRIGCDGNYEPGNCRWATWRQQVETRRPQTRR